MLNLQAIVHISLQSCLQSKPVILQVQVFVLKHNYVKDLNYVNINIQIYLIKIVFCVNM